ncbi:MAG: cation acetate symporter [Methylacidiphilales bacterium]|nr:cation acetate symporter [Candidatus Methylacidiphilales bacterium]MDW8350078.1 cation acetate symporter [Verrucomicrobiae bacterium]
MIYEASWLTVFIFGLFVALVLGISFYLGSRARSSSGYYAAHGQVHWFVNGVAFAGDYLSAASFLGICGMIAFFGYDGFLYSIGYLAGWIVALFVIAEPLKKLGKYTLADALDQRFHSQQIKMTAAISTLVVSVFYLIPQMVGAGALIKPLLGLEHWQGVILVGAVVTTIVITAGMISTTWVQFIKGALLVLFCALMTCGILYRGLETRPPVGQEQRVTILQQADGSRRVLINGIQQGHGENQAELPPAGRVIALPNQISKTGPLNPIDYLRYFQDAQIEVWRMEKNRIVEKTAEVTAVTTIYRPEIKPGSELLVPGGTPTFQGLRSEDWRAKIDFVSLMLALFAGTASLPHILIRYYTVKNQAAVRKSTVVGIITIGAFYLLTLYLGLGAMSCGALDMTNSNMAAPLLARTFGELPFALISAIAFTTVLGTVCGLILAASGAVVHDLMSNYFKLQLSDEGKVRAGKLAALLVGSISMLLGIIFERMNVTFLVGWAFNIAASANLPALVMVLFWKNTTKQGVAASIFVGLIFSLAWVLCSKEAYQHVYGWDPQTALAPFSQPAIVSIPLAWTVLIVVSKLTSKAKHPASSPAA